MNCCPLCSSTIIQTYAQDKKRDYFSCSHCQLVFADPNSWPSVDKEKSEYDLHQNDVNDSGYNHFLARIVEPLQQRLPAGSAILDFGCGPAPALAAQLTELGFQVRLFDVFYHNDPDALSQSYQAIVMTEVIEHLHQPMSVLQQLWRQIEKGGVLAIMTQRVISPERFQSWQYKNDPTHVCFYSEATFQWLAKTLNAQLAFVGRDMVFLTKH